MSTGKGRALDIRRYVGVCTACSHWQVDVRSGAVAEFGGWRNVLIAMAEMNAKHIDDECSGAGGGRIKVLGRWVEPPPMADGKASDGVLAFQQLPASWVSK